jgi:hypothetical protein
MYLTATEYENITGSDASEATENRLKRACLLLDARIGYYERDDDGWKLDPDGLANYQSDIVKEWVAWMVAFLALNNDQAPSAASVSLGRFSVTEHGQQGKIIPEQLGLVDAMLDDSGLVNRRTTLTHRTVDDDNEYDV